MANVAGVQYMSPNTGGGIPMPQGGGIVSGLKAFEAGRDITKSVKKDIDDKRMKRELDKFLVGLGDRTPTRGDFATAVKFLGPDGAAQLLQGHSTLREMEDADRKRALENMGAQVDLLGNVTDVLRSVPEPERPGMLAQFLTPMVQDNPTMREMVTPIAQRFQNGDFSDDNLDALATWAAGFGRYQEVHDNRLKAKAKKELEGQKLESKEEVARIEGEADIEKERVKARAKIEQFKLENPSPTRIVQQAQEMVAEFGGRAADWAVFLRDSDKFLGEGADLDGGFVNKATNQPLDLGKFSRNAGLPGDPLMTGDVGSPADMLKRKNDRIRRRGR